MDKHTKERSLFVLMNWGSDAEARAKARDLFDALPKTAWAALAVILAKNIWDAAEEEQPFDLEALKKMIQGACTQAHKEQNILSDLLPPPNKLPKC
jgi:hypothetical protein